MDNETFRGIFSALLTAFDAAGEFNERAEREMIRAELETGIRGFYVGGSTGEAFLLSPEERKALFRVTSEEARGRATLIAHVGDLSPRQAADYARCAAALGYDAVSSVAPFYYKYTPEQIAEYYRTLAEAAGLPVILYYVPALTGGDFGRKIFDELLADERILGVKYTSSDYFLFERLRRAHPDKILFNGYDETCLCGLVLGADGAIGSTYNVMGADFVRLYELARADRLTEARALQHALNDKIAFLLESGDVKAAVKYVMRVKYGINVGVCRAPGGDVPEVWKKRYENEFSARF